MDFLQKLNFMMKRKSLNKRTLSQDSGIPYTTIDGWYKKGYDGMKISTLRMLAGYFETTLDFWFQDDITDPNYLKHPFSEKNSPSASETASGDALRSMLLHNFDQLNQEGQEKLIDLSDDMVMSGKYIKSNPNKLGKAKDA